MALPPLKKKVSDATVQLQQELQAASANAATAAAAATTAEGAASAATASTPRTVQLTPRILYYRCLIRECPTSIVDAAWAKWLSSIGKLASVLPATMLLDSRIRPGCYAEPAAAIASLCLPMMQAFDDYVKGKLTVLEISNSEVGVPPAHAVDDILSGVELDEERELFDVIIETGREYAEFSLALLNSVGLTSCLPWAKIEAMDSRTLVKLCLRAAIRLQHMSAWLTSRGQLGSLATADELTAVVADYYAVAASDTPDMPAAMPRAWMEVGQWHYVQQEVGNAFGSFAAVESDAALDDWDTLLAEAEAKSKPQIVDDSDFEDLNF